MLLGIEHLVLLVRNIYIYIHMYICIFIYIYIYDYVGLPEAMP